jgi:hypothetical protein
MKNVAGTLGSPTYHGGGFHTRQAYWFKYLNCSVLVLVHLVMIGILAIDEGGAMLSLPSVLLAVAVRGFFTKLCV